MTREEVRDFLHENFQCKKTNMKTIKGIEAMANACNYKLVKKYGEDDYQLFENGIIVDFTKPLRINRELPKDLLPTKAYNGVPIDILVENYMWSNVNVELWSYLMNKKDGDIISFDEILHYKTSGCKDYPDIVFYFDYLTSFGYMKEEKDCIEIFAYPLKDTKYVNKYPLGDIERQAPYKFEK